MNDAGAGGTMLWRLLEWRLRRVVPLARVDTVIGDLAEDWARYRLTAGRLKAVIWLIREARSLERAYHVSTSATLPVSLRTPERLMLADDVRHGFRRLIARPGIALLCISLLALGIGLATAMFSVVDSLMFQRAPFPQAEQLVDMGFGNPEPALIDAWRATGMFRSVGAVRPTRFRAAESTAGSWEGAVVTPEIFGLLGVRPIRGRGLTAADARLGHDDVVLLSEVIWRSAFGGDPQLVGRRITLNDTSAVVIGIMPSGFRFPAPATMVWKPFDPARDTTKPPTITRIVGRLHPGVPFEDAEIRTGLLAHELGRLPANYGGRLPLQRVGRPDQLDAFTRQALWLLLGGVVLVFVVLCANVSSLLLAQLSARQREFGVCSAIGASRGRLIRQATIEHAVIAALGAAAGVGVAWGLIAVVPELFLGRTLNPIDVDPRALGAAIALGVAAVLLSGLLPAWIGTRSNPVDAVRGSRQAGTESRTARRATRWLLVGEVTLACSLLVGAALLARSFSNLLHADRGFSMNGLIHVDVAGLDDIGFTSRDETARGLASIVAAIRSDVEAWPEVGAVALSRELPPTWRTGTTLLGAPPPLPPRPALDASRAELAAYEQAVRALGTSADTYNVDPSFFDLFAIRILRGRALEAQDSERDAVVGERLAELLWPGEDAVGKTFTIGRTAGYRVVGVAGEIRLPTLDAALDRPELYLPLGTRSTSLKLSLRCRSTCPDAATMEARLRRVHPALGARIVTTAENTYLAQLPLPRAVAEVGGVFAIVTVLTAAGGLFSVMTYTVGRRRREFGIRAALGAQPGAMRRLIFREGFTLVAAGVLTGVVGGWFVARALSSFQYGVTVTDPAAWTAVIGVLALTTLGASWRPARQAARVDPVTLLREE